MIAVDIQDMVQVDGSITLEYSDIRSHHTQRTILDILAGEKADLVMSDMAPKASGIKSMDHEIIIELCAVALKFSLGILHEEGTFLCKIWQGQDQRKLEAAIKKFFSTVKVVKPNASRMDSAEVFLLAKNFQGVKGRPS